VPLKGVFLLSASAAPVSVSICPELTARDEPRLAHDGSTNALVRRYRARRAPSG